jgi:hypothetical protein
MHRTLHSTPGILLQFSGSTVLKGEVREREGARESEHQSEGLSHPLHSELRYPPPIILG